MILVCFRGKPFYITVIQVYAPTTNAEEGEAEWFYEDLQDFIELTPKKKKSFSSKSLQLVAAAMKLKDTCSLEEKL